MRRKSFLVAFATLSIAFGSAVPAAFAQAATWPNRAVTIIVPYSPGASNDLLARAVADFLTKKYGQPFVVDNRPGGGGVIGANAAIKAAPDGYTLLEHNSGIAGYVMQKEFNIDADRDLTPIAMLGRSPNALLTSKVHGLDTVEKLIAYSKANPETTFFSVPNIGNLGHLYMERFMNVTGATMKPVVYPGSAQMQTDLAAGRFHTMMGTVTAAQGLIESGQLNLLAYTDTGASPGAPKAPTLKELGIDFTYSIWWGIWGPAGMDKALTAKINAAINEAVQSPDYVDLLARNAAGVELQTPDQFKLTVTDKTAELRKMQAESKIVK